MMKGGLGKLMKQAQEMQANMQKAQEELANTQFTGQSGGVLCRCPNRSTNHQSQHR